MDCSSFSIVLIGETHGYLDDDLAIIDILRAACPEIILAEALQERQVTSEEEMAAALDDQDIDAKQVGRWLAVALREVKAKAYGIDVRGFGMDTQLRQIVDGKKEPTSVELERLEQLTAEREIRQVQMIERFRSKRPIVIIVGAWHLRDGSPLREATKGALMLRPKDENGTAVLGPGEGTGLVAFSHEVNE